ncbi:DUF418 domain-containing protein [Vulcaniibacterium tengchongense]|uniref:DUF418 domain-containing protein n=1 Tax=Vulcaniibacterium tengchongense TaxID=1273429 RepID=A0A3N4VJF7_9GAMM|nr:DUF418 domain-containing protein [Vulcaniibacterium tengchongense]RPE77177.1 uncharacterized protein EDC50_2442 [Vulcaniibacterium tengchongense]
MIATTPAPLPAPTAEHERIEALDALRGLALLGIFLMNVEQFGAPLVGMEEGIAPGQAWPDRVADAFVYVFVRSKFWTLFSLLFGMGFAAMLARAEARGAAFAPLYLRRSVALLAIGLAHALLVWSGDILVNYALAALLLLSLRRLPDSALWPAGASLYGAVIALGVLGALAVGALGALGAVPADPAAEAGEAALRQAEIEAYRHGGYAEATAMRLRYFLQMFWLNLALLPMVLGMFLIGAWFVRSGAIRDPAAHARLFRRLLWIGGPLGLAVTLASFALDPSPQTGGRPDARALLASTLHMAAAPAMALAYLAMAMLALQRGARWLRALAPAGRMALSNYLLQSLLGTWLFYGHGLGLWGEVGRAWQVAGVAAVFALQVAASRAWLARFRYGPVEWLWRGFTYGALPPMRRAAAR